MSAKYKSPSFLLPNELNTETNTSLSIDRASMYSMNFDGTSYINLGDSVPPFNQTTSKFSISFWLYSTEYPNAGNRCIFENRQNFSGGASFNSGIAFETAAIFSGLSKVFILRAYPSSSWQSVTFYQSELNSNEWNHIVIVFDGTESNYQNRIKIYVNNSAATLTFQQTNFPTQIAGAATGDEFRLADGYQPSFVGKMDEFCIFSKSLTSTDVSALYNSGSPAAATTVLNLGALAYYPLGEQAQNTGYIQSNGSDVSGSEWQFPNGALQDYVMDFGSSVGKFISLPNEISLSGEFAMSFWLKPTSNNINLLGNSSNTNYLYLNPSNQIVISSSDISQTFSSTIISSTSGNWQNLIITRDSNNVFRTYVNGNIANTVTDAGTFSFNQIGRYSNVSTNDYRGEMSNVAIWNTDQSTNKDNIYNNGSPQTTYTVTPQNWWKLNTDSVYTPSAPNYTSAVQFDSTKTDDLGLGTMSTLATATEVTFSIWAKITKGAGTINGLYHDSSGSIALKNSGFANFKYEISIKGTSDQLRTPILPNATFETWHHVVITLGTVDAKLYLNGELQDTHAVGTSTNLGVNAFLGRFSNTASVYALGGFLSNFSIFNSVLSESQVSTLFNFGTPETTPSFSPVHYWKLTDINTGLNDTGSLASNNATRGAVTGSGPTTASTSVAVDPSWKITNALPITTPNYTTALDFVSSSTTRIETTFNPLTSVGANNDFTVSAWVKPDNATSPNKQRIFGSYYASSNSRFWIGIRSGSFKFELGTQGHSFTRVLPSGAWSHIAVTYNNSTGLMTGYINGDQQGTSTQTAAATPSNANAWIGNIANDSSVPFNGELSNIAVYNTELSSSNIATLYNSGTPQNTIFGSPVGWWKLDNLTTGIQDSSGNGNNGTNNGATQVTSDVLTLQPANGVSTTLPSTALQQSDLQFDSPYSNYSLKFDVVSYVDTNFAIPNWTQYAYSIWFKFNGSTISGYDHLIGNLSSGANVDGRAIIGFNGTNLYLNMGDGTNYWFDESQSAAPLLDGNWHHIVLNVYETGQDVYVDGSLLRTYTYTGSVTTGTPATSNNYINKGGSASSSNGVDSSVDEHAIFNRLLTTAEILSIYNNGKPNDISSLSPSYWWRLGENAYFNNNTLTVPNSISGAPNGTGSGTVTSMLSADAPGTYSNGIGSDLDIVDRVGDAPLSTSNSQSYNMTPSNISSYVPAYVGNQIANNFSMTFDGVNSYFSALSPGFSITNEWSVSCWVKASNQTSDRGSYRAFFATGPWSGSDKFKIAFRDTDGYVDVWKGGSSIITGNTDIVNSQWHNVVLTKNSSTVTLFVDAVQQNSVSNSSTWSFANVYIGAGGYSNANLTSAGMWDGQVDEVAVFDTALSAGQIENDIYKASLPLSSNKTADLENNPNLPTPVAWYRMGD
jgi:hypothetical protein